MIKRTLFFLIFLTLAGCSKTPHPWLDQTSKNIFWGTTLSWEGGNQNMSTTGNFIINKNSYPYEYSFDFTLRDVQVEETISIHCWGHFTTSGSTVSYYISWCKSTTNSIDNYMQKILENISSQKERLRTRELPLFLKKRIGNMINGVNLCEKSNKSVFSGTLLGGKKRSFTFLCHEASQFEIFRQKWLDTSQWLSIYWELNSPYQWKGDATISPPAWDVFRLDDNIQLYWVLQL